MNDTGNPMALHHNEVSTINTCKHIHYSIISCRRPSLGSIFFWRWVIWKMKFNLFKPVSWGINDRSEENNF